MTLRLGYLNARAVAYAVKNELEKQGWDHLSPRPWNMYDPNNTFWWLIAEEPSFGSILSTWAKEFGRHQASGIVPQTG
jgi:hypothetical protein